MSKIGFKPIEITDGVSVNITDKNIDLSKGENKMSILLPKRLDANVKENKIYINRKKEYKKVKALHGLYRSIIQNAITGLNNPWEKKLEISGTGYGVKL